MKELPFCPEGRLLRPSLWLPARYLQPPRSEGLYNEACINLSHLPPGCVELEKLGSRWLWAYHRAMFPWFMASLEWPWTLKTKGMTIWNTMEKKSLRNSPVWKQPFLTFMSSTQQLHVLWSDELKERSVGLPHFLLALSSLASTDLSPTLWLEILLLY